VWGGETVVFCSPQKELWRSERKGARTLTLYVPVVPLTELLEMKRSLPQYKVSHACT
jgi:hypothetical protein